MKVNTKQISTNGERFYDITQEIKNISIEGDGMLYLFLPHTSCALAISEAYDPSAISDVGQFFKHLAPRNLSFITHTAEGPDDSPSHMKSILLHQTLTLMVEDGQIKLGTWQGIYLAEFRDGQHERKVHYKFIKD